MAYVAAFVAVLAAQGIAVDSRMPEIEAGRYWDTDGYTWLSAVKRIEQGAAWHDHVEPRSNWPYGEDSHYARPFAALLLAGAKTLSPLFGFDKALFLWGAAVAPIFYIGLAIATAAFAARVIGPTRGPAVLLLFACQYMILRYSLPGRADHHVHILTMFALTWGCLSIALLDFSRTASAAIAGVVAGIGLWMGLQFLLALAICHATLAVVWIRHGHVAGRIPFFFSIASAAVLAGALVVEQPPEAILSPRFDRIAIPHVLLLAFTAVFWKLLVWADGLGSTQSSWQDRAKLVLLGAGIPLGGIAVLFPQFVSGPLRDMDPRAQAVLLNVSELQGLWPSLWGWDYLLQVLGLAIVSVPGIIYLLVRDRAEPRQNVWIFLAIAIAIYVPFAINMRRFSIYAELVLVIVAAEILMRLFERSRQRPSLGMLSGAGAVMLATVLVSVSSVSAGVRKMYVSPADCDAKSTRLMGFLNTLGREKQRALTILAPLGMGPEILYRTDHRVIATPTRSNESGAIALYELLTARDDQQIERIVEERGIDLFIVCYGTIDVATFFESFFGRLMSEQRPAWVRQIDLPEEIGTTFALFETRDYMLDKKAR